MSKTVLADSIASRNDISKAEAKRAVDMVFDGMEAGLKGLKKGDESYSIGNFGTFYITKRKARQGINPRTGEPIKIKASRNLRFRPYAQLKRVAGC